MLQYYVYNVVQIFTSYTQQRDHEEYVALINKSLGLVFSLTITQMWERLDDRSQPEGC